MQVYDDGIGPLLTRLLSQIPDVFTPLPALEGHDSLNQGLAGILTLDESP
jgi:hypothetical protein